MSQNLFVGNICEFLKFLANFPRSGQNTSVEQSCRLLKAEGNLFCSSCSSGVAQTPDMTWVKAVAMGSHLWCLSLLVKFCHLCLKYEKTVVVQFSYNFHRVSTQTSCTLNVCTDIETGVVYLF